MHKPTVSTYLDRYETEVLLRLHGERWTYGEIVDALKRAKAAVITRMLSESMEKTA